MLAGRDQCDSIEDDVEVLAVQRRRYGDARSNRLSGLRPDPLSVANHTDYLVERRGERRGHRGLHGRVAAAPPPGRSSVSRSSSQPEQLHAAARRGGPVSRSRAGGAAVQWEAAHASSPSAGDRASREQSSPEHLGHLGQVDCTRQSATALVPPARRRSLAPRV